MAVLHCLFMNHAEFLFTIGYHGNTAIIDKKARLELGGLSPEGLLEKGMFKPAFCAAILKNDPVFLESFRELFNSTTGMSYRSVDELKRLFGVYGVPENVVKTISL